MLSLRISRNDPFFDTVNLCRKLISSQGVTLGGRSPPRNAPSTQGLVGLLITLPIDTSIGSVSAGSRNLLADTGHTLITQLVFSAAGWYLCLGTSLDPGARPSDAGGQQNPIS